MKQPCSASRPCSRAEKRSRCPRSAQNPSTTALASAKRSATPASGETTPIWNVIAYQVVPQVSTQTAKSCQVLNRCMSVDSGPSPARCASDLSRKAGRGDAERRRLRFVARSTIFERSLKIGRQRARGGTS